MARRVWQPEYGLPSRVLQGEIFAFHKKETKYEPPPPTEQEIELQNLLLEQIKKQDELRQQQLDEASQYQGLISDYLGSDPWTSALDEPTMSELNRIKGVYQDTRTTAINDFLTKAEDKITQKMAAKGFSDSTIANDAFTELNKEGVKAIDQVAKEAELFRYGTEQDMRSKILQDKLQKVGLVQGMGDPGLAASMLASFQGQRSEYANQALQVALANAQNSGSFGTALGSLLGMGLGGILAAPTGGMSILGGAALGGALGGTAGSLPRTRV